MTGAIVPLLLAAAAAPAAPAFGVEHLAVDGEVRRVDTADLDGDGKVDLLAVVVKGEGELAERSLAIFWNQGGPFSSKPDLVLPAAADLCAFDLSVLEGQAGAQLLELTPTGVRSRSFAGRAPGAPRTVVTEPTLFLVPPRGQLPRIRLAQSLGPRFPGALLLPGLGTLSIFSRAQDRYQRQARLTVDVKAAFGVPRRDPAERLSPGLPAFSVTASFPQVRVVDLNGDRKPDLALVDGDVLRGFVQTDEGFAAEPTFVHDFALRTGKELREEANVEVLLADVDGDGRADVVASKMTSKGIMSAKTTVSVFYATASGFPAKADQVIESDGAGIASVQLADITGDGQPDLLVPSMQLGVFSIIRVLTSSSMKVEFRLHPLGEKKRFSAKPTATRDLVFQISLAENTSDLQAVDMSGDLDGDGHPDLAFGVGKDQLALYRGGTPSEVFAGEPMATIAVRAFGHAITAPLDGGPRASVVLWYPETAGHRHELTLVRPR